MKRASEWMLWWRVWMWRLQYTRAYWHVPSPLSSCGRNNRSADCNRCQNKHLVATNSFVVDKHLPKGVLIGVFINRNNSLPRNVELPTPVHVSLRPRAFAQNFSISSFKFLQFPDPSGFSKGFCLVSLECDQYFLELRLKWLHHATVYRPSFLVGAECVFCAILVGYNYLQSFQGFSMPNIMLTGYFQTLARRQKAGPVKMSGNLWNSHLA